MADTLQQNPELKNQNSTTGSVADTGATQGAQGALDPLRSQGYADGAAALSPNANGEAAEKQRVAAAQAKWEALLGQSIGGKAFDAIRKHLSVEDLLEYAKKATESLSGAMSKAQKPTEQGVALGIMDEASEAEAVSKFLAALAPTIQAEADKWLESESGQKLRTDVSQWVEEHPGIVVGSLAAVLVGAAAAAYLSNVDIPEFKKTVKIGERWSVDGGVDLGRIQSLAVQAASLAVAYESDKIRVSLGLSYEKKAENGVDSTVVGATADLKKGESLTLAVQGNVTDVGGRIVATSANGTLTIVDAKNGRTYSLGADGKWNEDGSGEQGVKLSRQVKQGDTVVGNLELGARTVTLVGSDGTVLRTTSGSIQALVSPKGSRSVTVAVHGKVEETEAGLTVTSYDGELKVVSADGGTSHTLGVDGRSSTDGAGETGIKYVLETKSGENSSGRLELGGRQVIVVDSDGNATTTQQGSIAVKVKREGYQVDASTSLAADGSAAAALSGSANVGQSTEISTKGEYKVDAAGVATVKVDGDLSTLVYGTPLTLGASHQSNDSATDPQNQWGGKFRLEGADQIYDLSGHYDYATDSFRFVNARELRDGTFKYAESVERDSAGVTTGTDSFNYNPAGAYSYSFANAQNSNGQQWQTFGAAREAPKDGGFGFNASGTVGDKTSANVGVNYRDDKFKAALDAAMGDAKSSVSGSASYQVNDNLSASGSANYNLTDDRLDALALELGYRDKENFRSFVASYKRAWEQDNKTYSDKFGVMFEHSIRSVQIRLQGNATLRDGQLTNMDANALGAYQVAPDWKVLGGAGYGMNRGLNTDIGTDSYYLQGGVQYKDVGVVIKYTPDQGGRGQSATVGIVIPF